MNDEMSSYLRLGFLHCRFA